MIPKKSENSPYKENLAGKEAKIKTNDQKMFEGKITLETKKTIQIATKNGNKTIIKKNAIIIIDNHEIKGEKINKRTEDRIKAR